MRSALGAARGRLFRQVMTESAALAMRAPSPARASPSASSRCSRRSAATRFRAPTRCGRLAGVRLRPGRRAARRVCRGPAAGAARVASRPRSRRSRAAAPAPAAVERRLLGAVATLQIVLTVALLAGAALLIRTARNLDRMRPGYDTENILAMTVTTVEREQGDRVPHAGARARSRLPGVTRAAFVWGVPLTGNKWPADDGDSSGSRDARPGRSHQLPDPLRHAGLLRGDGHADRRWPGVSRLDDADAPRVAIVNETLAQRYFASATPSAAVAVRRQHQQAHRDRRRRGRHAGPKT